VRVLLGLGIVGVAVWFLSSKGSELAGFADVFKRVDWYLIPFAFAAEIGSYVCFAAMQYELLKAGKLRAPFGPLVKVSFGGQALTNSLPAGTAVASVYGFRWFRRFGADNTLAAWALAGTLVASVVSLALVALIGLGIAADEGASLDLVPVIVVVFALTLALGALFVYERPLRAVVTATMRASVSVFGRPRGDTAAQVERIMDWMTAVRLGWTQVGRIVTWGTINWLLDCACFALMFVAIDEPIPWKGLLLAYGAGQLAATLPFTPGGLGVVEGSITVALVAFGGAESTTVDAVLLYRVISFWFILAIGWLFIGQLVLQVRRGKWSRQAMASEVEAGPVAYEGRPASTTGPEPPPAPSPNSDAAPSPTSAGDVDE
jgi:putative heme transporter